MTAPPDEALTTLLNFVNRSHITGILEQAEVIERKDRAFLRFSRKVAQLAENFEFDRISTLVRLLRGDIR